MDQKKITFNSFIRGFLFFIVIVGILLLINRLSSVLLPFFIAWVIAYLLYPLVKFFQYKLKFKNRILAIFCAILSITLLGGLAGYLIIPPTLEEFGKVNTIFVEYVKGGFANRDNIPQTVTEFLHENVDMESARNFFSEINITNIVKKVIPQLWNIVSESVNIIFSILASFIILLYIIFILLDYESIAEGWIHLLPKKYRTFTNNLVTDIQVAMNTYFRGQALVALCVGILFSIGFLIIDFPLAIGLGLFIGLLNMVPYLQIIGFIPTTLLAILKAADTGQNFWYILLAALIVFAIVQTIQDTIIVPKIMGKITGLNPAIILLSLSIWGSLMGIIGMIIALPLTTLMLSYYQRFIINQESIKEALEPNEEKLLEKK